MVFRCIPQLSVTGLLVALLTASTSGELPHREPAPHRCSGCATGQCQTSTPHGFWKPTWRRWPGATTYRGFKRPTPELDVPQSEVPAVVDETRINARTRVNEPLEEGTGAAVSPPAVDLGSPAAGGVGGGLGVNETPASPFTTGPETAFPATTPPTATPVNPEPPADMPAPPGDLFEDLSPTTNPPAESPLDDNLFDDLGAAPTTIPEPEMEKPTISQRSIRSRRVAATTPSSASVLTGLTVGEGNQLTDLLPSSLVAGMQRQLTPPQEQQLALTEMPVLIPTQPEASEIPLQPLPVAEDRTVTQVSHEQEAIARDDSTPTTGSGHNPLRGPHRAAFSSPERAAPPAAASVEEPSPEFAPIATTSQEPRKIEVTDADHEVPQPAVQRRVHRGPRRLNPLRS